DQVPGVRGLSPPRSQPEGTPSVHKNSDPQYINTKQWGLGQSVVGNLQHLADPQAIGVGNVVGVDDLPDADLVFGRDALELVPGLDGVASAVAGRARRCRRFGRSRGGRWHGECGWWGRLRRY